MMERSTTTLPGVQILRGLAACSVMVHHVLEELQPLFGDRILVVGAGGFIGAAVVRSLVAGGSQIFAGLRDGGASGCGPGEQRGT